MIEYSFSGYILEYYPRHAYGKGVFATVECAIEIFSLTTYLQLVGVPRGICASVERFWALFGWLG